MRYLKLLKEAKLKNTMIPIAIYGTQLNQNSPTAWLGGHANLHFTPQIALWDTTSFLHTHMAADVAPCTPICQ